MIKAQHNKTARFVFDIYIRRLLKKSFSAFYLMSEVPDLSKESAAVITPNHFSWWDGFFVDYVNNKCLNKRFHIMMLEEQLKRYWFFRKLGAYSIDPGASSVRESILYTRHLLSQPQNLVVTYPQGKIEPADVDHLLFNDGIRLVVSKSENIEIFPAAFKIEYSEERLPAVFCRLGKKFTGKEFLNGYENYKEEFNGNLIELKKEIISGKPPVLNLLKM